MYCSAKTTDRVYLTPDLLTKFAFIARALVGAIIETKKESDMMGLGAYVFHEGQTDFVGQTMHQPRITLSASIDVDKFYAKESPEMDWRKIPRDNIYTFLVYHEMGHVLLGPKPRIIRNTDGSKNDNESELFVAASELRADRFAWKALFPHEPLPVRRDKERTVQLVEAYIRDHKEFYADKI